MSRTTVLGWTPDRPPIELVELPNASGWLSSIWSRLLRLRGEDDRWWLDNERPLERLWHTIDHLPEWQQVPLVLTFDTGVIPWQEYDQAAAMLDEFDVRCPSPHGHANHVPAVAEILRSRPECPFVGVHGTSVTECPFSPFDLSDDDELCGHLTIGLDQVYVLGRYRHHVEGLPEFDPWQRGLELRA